MITSIGIITLNTDCAEKEEEFGEYWGDKRRNDLENDPRPDDDNDDEFNVNLPDKNSSKFPDPYTGGIGVSTAD